jgi:AcrR family transcriptional regulator
MKRSYDSTRRRHAAEQTRRDILRAALRLHWKGVTEYGPLAEAAGVSLATVRKYFPTKEDLFQNCTRTFAESLVFPDIAALGRISSRNRRLEECVSELCRIHEAMIGYAWLSAHARNDSPTLDAEMKSYEGLSDAICDIIVPNETRKSAVVRSLLDFLTYRALRFSGELSPDEAREELITILRPIVLGDSNRARGGPP